METVIQEYSNKLFKLNCMSEDVYNGLKRNKNQALEV